MIKLSIITINYNNAEGLRKTLASVAAQTYPNIEHIIVDGNSTDGSVDVIREYESTLTSRLSPLASRLKWVSEPDKGIYNAMNKGIEIALGRRVVNDDHTSQPILNPSLEGRTSEQGNNPLPFREETEVGSHYIQILNSGDILAAPDVTERMMAALASYSEQCERSTGEAELKQSNLPSILYGNMIKVNAQGKVVGKSGYTEYSLRQFYSSTLNHDCAYIRRDLFEEYGLYDEQLKIVSDWKWYLQVIGLGRVKPDYVDIDVTIFDDGGISEQNLPLRYAERRQVLEELLPPAVLWDYDMHAFEMEQMKRLRRWKMYWLVYLIERTLFKLEKWGVLRR